ADGELLLSRCENSTRRLIHRTHATRLLPGVIYQIDVWQQASTLRARLFRPADASAAPWEIVVSNAARPGQPGVCVTTDRASTAQSLHVRSYALHAPAATATPPRAAVLITGTPPESGVSVGDSC